MQFLKENGTLLVLLVFGTIALVFGGILAVKGLVDPSVFFEKAFELVLGGGGLKVLHSFNRRSIDAALTIPGQTPTEQAGS